MTNLQQETKGVRRYMASRNQIEGLLRILEITDRAISDRNLNVWLSASPSTGFATFDQAPAWTDGEDIFVNEDKVIWDVENKSIDELVAGLKGLNYHELAHILHTPRLDGPLANRVRNSGRSYSANTDPMWWWAFNALEDQRAEMMFGTQYSLAFHYFRHTNLLYIIKKNEQDMTWMLPLMHGRLFLPAGLRDNLYKLYKDKWGKGRADEVRDISEQYIITDSRVEIDEAYDLIERLVKVLEEINEERTKNGEKVDSDNPIPILVPGGHFTPIRQGDRGRKQPTRWGDRTNPQVQEHSGIRVGEPDDDTEDIKSKVADRVSDEKKAREDRPTAQDEPAPAPEEDEGEDDGPSFKNLNPKAADVDLTPLQEAIIDSLKEAAGSAIADGLESAQVKADLDKTITASKAGKGDPKWSEDIIGKYTEVDVSADMRLAVNRITPIMREIQLDLEPHWKKNQTSGRLDPYKAAAIDWTADLDIFDLWDEGAEEEGGVEVVMLLDLSSSMKMRNDHKTGLMAGPIDEVSKMAWVFNIVFERLKIPCTMFGYSDGVTLLAFPHERESRTHYRRFEVFGGTQPSEALLEAWNVFRRSKHKNHLLVTLTDGQWASYGRWQANENRGQDAPESIIQGMNYDNVHTVLFGVKLDQNKGDGAVKRYGDHNCQIARDVDTPMGLVDPVSEMVEQVMKAAAFDHID